MQKDDVEMLAGYGLIESALVYCGPDGIELYITPKGKSETFLRTARGKRRVFASIDTAIKFLVDCGWVGHLTVEVSTLSKDFLAKE